MKKVFPGHIMAGFLLFFFFLSCNKDLLDNEKINLKSQSLSIALQELDNANYYWSGKKKISLSIDTTAMIFLPKDSVLVNRVSQDAPRNALEKLRSGYYLIGTNNINKERKADINTNAANSEFVYKTADNRRLTQTGEILLRPRQGITVERILAGIPASISIAKRSKYNTYVLKVNNKINVVAIANVIYERGEVEYCHPNFLADLSKTSSDNLYSSQYYLENTGQNGGTNGIDIHIADWAITAGFNCGIKVAVIDDGVEDHDDISGRVLTGYTPTNPTGYGAPISSSAHGEACAGIIAASKDNTIGIAGVAPNVDIIPVNIFAGGEDEYDIEAAIRWAYDDGAADVISNSWSYNSQYAYFDNVKVAIDDARSDGRGSLGSVVVFSSGNFNGSWSGVAFPGNVSGVVTVGAIDNDGTIWSYSSRGSEMDLVAPSGLTGLQGDVTTTDRMGSNGYNSGDYTSLFGGTSATCPQVSGVAALILSIDPSLTESQVRSYLTSSVSDMGSGGFDNTFGYGRVDAAAACSDAAVNAYPISGPSQICNDGATTEEFTITNMPGGATVTWTTSNHLLISGSNTGTSVLIYDNPAIGGSVGAIHAIITLSGCGSVSVFKGVSVNSQACN